MIPQFVPYWGGGELDEISGILKGSGYLNEHETVRKFEREFAGYVGARYCVAVPSGTTALYCAANALGLQEENRVGVPTHDGIFAFNALTAAGCSPEVYGVNPSGPLDAGDGSFIAVHANGRISGVRCALEDCAQAISHHTPGRVGAYSFASTKHITTGGQGGAVCCDDAEIFDTLVRLKDHGRNDRQLLRPMSDRYDTWGMNFKMTELQAAFGLVQLRGLAWRLKRLHEIYSIYRDILIQAVEFDEAPPGWYVDIFTPKAGDILQRLKSKGIYCRQYPRPLHMQKVAAGRVASSDFGTAEKRYKTGLYLPSTTNLSDEDVKFVAEEILHAVA